MKEQQKLSVFLPNQENLENYNKIELTTEEELKAFAPVLEAKKHKFYSEVYANSLISGKSQQEAVSIADKLTQSENFKLTDEETNECLKTAKESKFYKLKTNNYFHKISKPVDPVVPHFEEFKNSSEARLKDITGSEVEFSNQYNYLLEYFSSIKGGYNRDKGILIQGPVGCGKTSLMKVFARNPVYPYSVVSCRQVARSYKEGGMSGIDKYMNVMKNGMAPMFYNQKMLGWCFDDLGTESAKKNYGDELNVMAEIFLNWYDKGGFNRIHITTNLRSEDIESLYGYRVRSRIREMFNIVKFEPYEKDKRR